ncbi:streptophobe family protein [Streptomyces sp. NBC_01433]|uniref:streptophobe family protein n=1 Tax=Streptomyces sp. NBC_01433 TaxID=2903864 RepID=UPI0022518DC8|nr:streptophobe family protein [Streptomyces sp. NBC_01433]MCX4679046.1 streptophobe family protein [Streptomyces sp. NBC_01433]
MSILSKKNTSRKSVLKGPATVTRHFLEGAGSLIVAVTVMALVGYTALRSLHAESIGPLTQLVPLVLAMAVGGSLTLSSAGGTPAVGDEAAGGGLGGLLGGTGGGGGMSLEVTGGMDLMPLSLTLIGSVVLATLFYRPLGRRARPTGPMLGVRFGGAALAAVTLFAAVASQASGRLRLPESVTSKIGKGKGGSRTGGRGLSDVMKDVAVDVDAGAVAVQGITWALVVLLIGCVVARRTTLPRGLATSSHRLKWNPVTSAVADVYLALALVPLLLSAALAAVALSGRDLPGAAGKAIGGLLLLTPNLLTILLTSGQGFAWLGTMERQQGNGGLGGMLTGQAAAAPESAPRAKKVMDIAVAGIPLWAVGLALLMSTLLVCGYVATARTPRPIPREAANALLGFHLQIAVRIGVITSVCTVLVSWLTTASGGFGISIMGMQMGGATADLSGDWLLACLTGGLLGGAAGYGGSHLHRLLRMRRPVTTPIVKRRPGPGRSQSAPAERARPAAAAENS